MATINHKTYNEATETFKDFNVYDGKETLIFKVDGSTGNVGIGINPAYKLDVESGNIRVSSASSGEKAYTFYEESGGPTGATVGYDGNTNSLFLGTTDDNNATITQHLVIPRATGNVGIGTSSPSEKLVVNGSVVWQGALVASQTNSGALDRSGNDLRIRAYGATAGTGNLVFRTGGGGGSADSEAMRIDSAGLVGIGTASPDKKLSVKGNTANPSLVSLTGSFGTSRGGVISLDADELGAVEGALKFTTNVTAPYGGYVFSTQSGEKLRILSSGGITFNGDTAAANALDDYEEGTFTPTMLGATFSLTTASGYYTKIGRQVSIWVECEGTYSTPTGVFRVSSLPFTQAGGRAEGVFSAVTGISFGDYCSAETIGAVIYLESHLSGTGANRTDMNSTYFNSAGFRFMVSQTYFV